MTGNTRPSASRYASARTPFATGSRIGSEAMSASTHWPQTVDVRTLGNADPTSDNVESAHPQAAHRSAGMRSSVKWAIGAKTGCSRVVREVG